MVRAQLSAPSDAACFTGQSEHARVAAGADVGMGGSFDVVRASRSSCAELEAVPSVQLKRMPAVWNRDEQKEEKEDRGNEWGE